MEVAVLFVVWAILPVPSQAADKSTTTASAFVGSSYDVFGGKQRRIDIPKETFPKEEELRTLEQPLDGCEHGWFGSVSERAQLHYRAFLPPDDPKGIVIFHHGIAAHSGRALVMEDGRKLGQALLSERLVKDDIALYSFDYLGHGFSEGSRWYVPDYKTNRDDCIAFVKFVASQHEEGTPIFLMGESYGGCLTLHVRQFFEDRPEEKPEGLESVLLVAPAIIGDLPPYPIYFLLRYVLGPLFPRWIPFFMPNPVSKDRIWRDPLVLSKMDRAFCTTRLDGGGLPFRLGTAVSLVIALEEVRDRTIPKFRAPFCVVHGTADFAVPVSGTDFLEEHCRTPVGDREIHRIPEAAHDLLADPAAEETVRLLLEFIEKRIDSQKDSEI